DKLGNGRALLADSDIDAEQLVGVGGVGVVGSLLVEEGVQNDRGLAGLTVTDDQLALATTNRDQSVNSLEAGRHWLMNRLTRNDARCLDVDAATFGSNDWAFTVDWIAESIDNAAEQARADWNVNDRAGTLDDVAFLDVTVGTENNHTDIVGFEVKRHAANTTREFDHLAGLDFVEAIDTGNTVTDGQHLADFGNLGFLAEILDLVLEDRRDFRGFDVHLSDLFHGDLHRGQFCLERRVDHLRPDLHLKATDQRGINELVERDALADLGLERFAQRLDLLAGERGCRSNVCRHFATRCSGQVAERHDDRVEREQPAILGDKAKEVGDHTIGGGLGQERFERTGLGVGGDHWRTQEARKIFAFPDQAGHVGKRRLNRCQLILALGEVEQRRRIWPSDVGKH
uniref:NAD-specific glutamate dehydrogenase n=1 Tax=Parastrongyloides trichosuri TaxID=131310 RepID=A0A0N4Z8Y7_PARTI